MNRFSTAQGKVWPAGFEPALSGFQGRRGDRAPLRPEVQTIRDVAGRGRTCALPRFKRALFHTELQPREERHVAPTTDRFGRSSQTHAPLCLAALAADGLVCASLPPFVPGSVPVAIRRLVLRGGVLEPGPASPSGRAGPFSLGRGLGHIWVFFKLGITLSESSVWSFGLAASERKRAANWPPSSGASCSACG